MIDYIVDNAVFTVDGKAYRQVIGIPMGTDPAPVMANLYLFYYEHHYMKQLMETNYRIARKYYSHTRRFIDDLATLNNNGHLGENWKTIYPEELILNKENSDNKAATFLDLDIRIEDSQLRTKIYDKRDAFNFDIISYPDLSSNIPENPAYGVSIGQFLRIARNTTLKKDFIQRTRTLVKKLYKKGYQKGRLRNSLRKTIHRYDDIQNKFDLKPEGVNMIIKDILQ